MDEYDHLFKLLLVGDSGVGKTSLLLKFTQGEVEPDKVNTTVGVDLKVKMMTFQQRRLKLTIWDTAGQERFRTLTSAYYRGAHGIILVYDLTRRETFAAIKDAWLKEIDIYSTNEDSVKLLVGNKLDLESKRQVTKAEATEFARREGMLYIEASALSGDGVQHCFEELLQKVLDSPTLLKEVDRRDKLRVDQANTAHAAAGGDDDGMGMGCC